MSLKAHGAVATWPDLPARLWGVAHVLADCQNSESGLCFPSISYLAKKLRCRERATQRLLRDLEVEGVISILPHFEQGRQTANRYIFHDFVSRNISVADTETQGGRVSKTTGGYAQKDIGEGAQKNTPGGVQKDTQNQEKESGRRNQYMSRDEIFDTPAPKHDAPPSAAKRVKRATPLPSWDSVQKVIDRINLRSGRKHLLKNRKGEYTEDAKLVRDRLGEWSLEEALDVVDLMAAEWLGDDKMSKYFRIKTLFSKKNFEQYRAQTRKPTVTRRRRAAL